MYAILLTKLLLLFTANYIVFADGSEKWTIAKSNAIYMLTLVTVWVKLYHLTLLWPPYEVGRPLYFCPVVSFFPSSSFFPRLISAVADWMTTILPHMVWPQCEFRMHVWNVRHAARWKYRTQKSRQKSPSGHHRTTSSGYIFANKACIDNQKTTC